MRIDSNDAAQGIAAPKHALPEKDRLVLRAGQADFPETRIRCRKAAKDCAACWIDFDDFSSVRLRPEERSARTGINRRRDHNDDGDAEENGVLHPRLPIFKKLILTFRLSWRIRKPRRL